MSYSRQGRQAAKSQRFKAMNKVFVVDHYILF